MKQVEEEEVLKQEAQEQSGDSSGGEGNTSTTAPNTDVDTTTTTTTTENTTTTGVDQENSTPADDQSALPITVTEMVSEEKLNKVIELALQQSMEFCPIQITNNSASRYITENFEDRYLHLVNILFP